MDKSGGPGSSMGTSGLHSGLHDPSASGLMNRYSGDANMQPYDPVNSFGNNIVNRGTLASSAGRAHRGGSHMHNQHGNNMTYEESKYHQSSLRGSYGPGAMSSSLHQGHRSSQKSPARSGAMTATGQPVDLDEQDYSLSVSDLNSNSFYKSGRT